MDNLRCDSKQCVDQLGSTENKMLFDFLKVSSRRNGSGQSVEDGILHSLSILYRRGALPT